MSDDYAETLDRRRQAEEVQDQLEHCEGWSLWHDLRSIEDSEKVFWGNHQELNLAAVIVDDPGRWLPLASRDNREGHAKYMDEMDRLFHNYLASAYSLSSCMWKIYERRGWALLPEGAEYLRRSPRERPGLTAFVFGLRHLAQHQRIPLTTSGSRGWRDEAGRLVSEDYFMVVLDAIRRLDWSRDKRGAAYLQTLIEDPRLDHLIPTFTTELLRFAAWFKAEFARVYAKELRELEELHIQHTALMQPFYDANRPEPRVSSARHDGPQPEPHAQADHQCRGGDKAAPGADKATGQ